jgi:hypothetical protein
MQNRQNRQNRHTRILFFEIAFIPIVGLLLTVSSISNHYTSAQLLNKLGVKIISPTKGQQVQAGSNNLVFSGTSTDDKNSDCKVGVIFNYIKPYQQAVPIGHNGTNDYSTWVYTLKPNYTVVKEGVNKVTAKLTCTNNSTTLTKFYSVNFTGVSNTSTNQQKLNGGPIKSAGKNTSTVSLPLPTPIQTKNIGGGGGGSNIKSGNNSPSSSTTNSFNNEATKIVKSFNNKVKH